MAITTDIDRFRLELGDRPAAYGLLPPRPDPDTAFEAVRLFADDEIQHFLDQHPSSVLLAVAAACDTLAVQFAQDVDMEDDGQALDRSQKSKMYAQMAAQLRKRAREDEQVASGTAGMPIGRVPCRTATTWREQW